MQFVGNLHIIRVTTTVLKSLSLLTTWATGTEWRGSGKLNHLLRLNANHEGWDVDHLLTDTDVTLLDEASCMVNGESQTRSEDASLETTIKKLLWSQTQNIVQLLLRLSEETQTSQTTEEGSTFEETLWILGGWEKRK